MFNFSNLRDAKAEIERLGAEATSLTTRVTEAESKVTDLTTRATDAESKVTELTTELDSSKNEVKSLTERAEKAEQKLIESEAKQGDFDKKVKDAATVMATSQLAAVGHKPVDGDNSSSEPGSSNQMDENKFWSTYRALKPSDKAKWYEENKALIGR